MKTTKNWINVKTSLFVFFIALLSFTGLAQNQTVDHQLKGITVRSSVIFENKGLLGTKGDKKGAGFVYGLNKKGI